MSDKQIMDYYYEDDDHMMMMMPVRQDELLAEAVKNNHENNKRSSRKTKLTWFKKIFPTRRQFKNESRSKKNKHDRGEQHQDYGGGAYNNVVVVPNSSRNMQQIPTHGHHAVDPRTSGPFLFPQHYQYYQHQHYQHYHQHQQQYHYSNHRNFADQRQQWHRTPVPLEIGTTYNSNGGGGGGGRGGKVIAGRIRDEDNISDMADSFDDQWEVGSSDLEHGCPNAAANQAADGDFDSEDDSSDDDDDDGDKFHVAQHGPTTTAAKVTLDKVQNSNAKNPGSYAATIDDDKNQSALDGVRIKADIIVEAQQKSKSKKNLDESTKDATDSTVDLEFSSGDWTTNQEFQVTGREVIANEKKKKKSVQVIKENIQGEEEEEVASANEKVETPKRVSKKDKNGVVTALASDSTSPEASTNEENTKTSKTKSRKSAVTVAEEYIDETTPDNEYEETGKKSRRKSKKPAVTIEAYNETTTDRDHSETERLEAAAAAAEEKNISKKERRKKSKKGITELIGPTTIHVNGSDDISILTEAHHVKTKDNASGDEETPLLIKSRSKRKSSKRKSSKRKSTRESQEKQKTGDQQQDTQDEEAISLSSLLDDVVKIRTRLQESLEEESSHNRPTMSQNILEFMERMLDSFAEVSDALELQITFGGGKKESPEVEDANEALKCISDNYVPFLNYVFKVHLQQAVERCWWEESKDDKFRDLLNRVAVILAALTAQFRDQFIERRESVGSIEQNPETKRLFVTLFELLRHEAFAVGQMDGHFPTQAPSQNSQKFQPSAMLQESWGVTSDSQIWHEVYAKASESPREFRRACIRFVVNESEDLVICPEAMGILLDYCEFELSDLLDSSTFSQLADAQPAIPEVGDGHSRAAAIPEAAKLVLENISGAPVARDLLVHDILNRILKGSASVTVLQGRPCVGKTTVAALIAQHRSIRRHFKDGIGWIRLGRAEGIGYAGYLQHLKAIAALFVDPIDFQQESILYVPGESKAERGQRERRKMSQAKAKMIALLNSKRISMLIILDNLINQDDLEWFDFSREEKKPSVAVLVTTRNSDLVEETNAPIAVSKLSEEKEAAWLLHRECNSTTRALCGRAYEMPARTFFESDLVKAMVQLCSLHPLAVATLGRFISLHYQQNCLSGQESLVSVGQLFTDFHSKGGIAAFLEILGMSLSPTACDDVPSRAIRLCLMAYVNVFCTDKQVRDHVGDTPFPTVPMAIVELLFESVLVLDDEVLKEEAFFYQNKEKAAELIQKVLSVLGILSDPTGPSSSQTTYLTHEIYAEYAKDQVKNDGDLAQFAAQGGKAWHRALVSNLLDSSEDWDEFDYRQDYLISSIPFHMICAEMFVEAGEMLSKRQLVKRRIGAFGLRKAVSRQIKDVEFLLERLVPSSDNRIDSKPCYIPVVHRVYQNLVDAIIKMDDTAEEDDTFDKEEVSQALLDIGLSFSEWHCYEDAINCWNTTLLMSSMTVAERSEVLFCVGAAYGELQDYEAAMTFVKESLQLRRISAANGTEDSDLSCALALQKIGDLHLQTTTTTADSSEAIEAYSEALAILANHDHDGVAPVELDAERCIGRVHEMLGRIFYKRGEQVTSLDHYMSALQSKKRVYGKKSQELVTLYMQIGIAVLDLKKKEDAKEAFSRAVKLVETDDEDIDLYNPDFLIPKGILSGMDRKKKVSKRCFKRAREVLEGDLCMENEWKLSFVMYVLTMFE